MGTLQKLFSPKPKTGKTYKPERLKDSERISFSPRRTAKNNRKCTPGRKFYYQTINLPDDKKRVIKHMVNEAH